MEDKNVAEVIEDIKPKKTSGKNLLPIILVVGFVLILAGVAALGGTYLYLKNQSEQESAKNQTKNEEKETTPTPTAVAEEPKNVDDMVELVKAGIAKVQAKKSVGMSVEYTDGDEVAYQITIKQDFVKDAKEVKYSSMYHAVIGPSCEGECNTLTYVGNECSTEFGKDYDKTAGAEYDEKPMDCKTEEFIDVDNLAETFEGQTTGDQKADTGIDFTGGTIKKTSKADGSYTYVMKMKGEDRYPYLDTITAEFAKDGALLSLKYPIALGYIEVTMTEFDQTYNITLK